MGMLGRGGSSEEWEYGGSAGLLLVLTGRHRGVRDPPPPGVHFVHLYAVFVKIWPNKLEPPSRLRNIGFATPGGGGGEFFQRRICTKNLPDNKASQT